MKVKHNTYTVPESSALMYALNRRQQRERLQEARRERWQRGARVFFSGTFVASLAGKLQGAVAKAVYGLWKKGYFSQFPEFSRSDAVSRETPQS